MSRYPYSQEVELAASWNPTTGAPSLGSAFEIPDGQCEVQGGVLSVVIQPKTSAAPIGSPVLSVSYGPGSQPFSPVEISVPAWGLSDVSRGWAGAWWIPGKSVNVKAGIEAPLLPVTGNATIVAPDQAKYAALFVWTPGPPSRPILSPQREFSYNYAASNLVVTQRIPPLARRVLVQQTIPEAIIQDLQQRDAAGRVFARWSQDLLTWPAAGTGTFGVSRYPWLDLACRGEVLQLTYGTVPAALEGSQSFLFELAL